MACLMPTAVFSAQVVGLDARIISVEADITPGLHIFSIVGLADKEVQESRERIAAAIKNVGGLAPHKKSQRVIINLAPADIKKEGPAFDLPIAVAYLLASHQLSFDPERKLFLGELGLDGAIRRVPGALPVAISGRAAGFRELFVPKGNGAEAAMVHGIEVREIAHVGELIDHFSGKKIIIPLPITPVPDGNESQNDFSHIRGQEKAKRALEIAAAGGHNILMAGPPGVGKTILAQTLSSILPPLIHEEMLEVTKIYSIAGLLGENNPFIKTRPFRNPHHTSSHSAVIGGGPSPRPGEVTLAHRGVLFLDEFPEFDRRVLESLRQPLEERRVTIARAQGVATFPAHFILVAAMNPCPCGNFGNPKKDCTCSSGAVAKYTRKVSGPLLDRIDLYVGMPPVEYEKLESGEDAEPSRLVRERVIRARAMQGERFRNLPIRVNTEMGLPEIKKFLTLTPDVKPLLYMAHKEYHLSARAHHRLLKLSRTIADLEGASDIQGTHLMEALQYRPKSES